jgi:transcriptional regulator of acetoin/glycerol metabolism
MVEKGGDAMKMHSDEHKDLVEAARKVQENRSGIVLSGQIKDGKVELDERTLEDIKRNFAGSDRAFVAVNAPFDPNSSQA